MELRNWAGNVTFNPSQLHQPTDVDELRSSLVDGDGVRVLGSRHSFTDLAAGDTMIDVRSMPHEYTYQPATETIRVTGHSTYGMVAKALQPHGRALPNMASLPHISVAGAIATGTHGSGERWGGLGTAVSRIEFLTAGGEAVMLSRGDAAFPGAVIHLGALGVVTHVTLDTVPSFHMRQQVFEHLAWDRFLAHFDEIQTMGWSVSAFTCWGDDVEQVWIKERVELSAAPCVRSDLFGAAAATVNRHPVLSAPADSCTPQLGAIGLWSDRLPHFRHEFEPSVGDEIQSEFFVGRDHAPAAIEAMIGVGSKLADVLLVSEVRTVKGDDLWMSPCYGRDSVVFHFTWVPDAASSAEAAATVAAALAPFAPRPHWGKVFPESTAVINDFERAGDFVALARSLDPGGRFWNPWLERNIAGSY